MTTNNKTPTFVTRNSLLIDLFENIHIRTVYHLFIAIFIGLFVNTFAYDYLKTGKIVLGFGVIKFAFEKVHIALLIWTGYFVCTCMVFYFFTIWGKYRNLGSPKCWDAFWTFVLFGYYCGSFKLAEYLVVRFKLPPASAAIVVIEQTRFLMKIHSFVRTKSCSSPATFDKFLYFLFVPTLIYQDIYPRSKKINWKFVFFRTLECLGAILYLSFVIDRFLKPSIQDFGLRKYRINEIILTIFENTVTGIFMLLPGFFLVIHSWQNLVGELTRFGDRLFYTDWWTCTDYSEYFRKWNMIVQQWLYVYIYKDFNEHVFYGNSTLSKMAVFLISAVVHEWILMHMFGFFFPLCFIEFVFCGLFLHCLKVPKRAIFNVLFWYSLALGTATLVVMYGIEYYARINKPLFEDTLVPRFLTCDCIELQK